MHVLSNTVLNDSTMVLRFNSYKCMFTTFGHVYTAKFCSASDSEF